MYKFIRNILVFLIINAFHQISYSGEKEHLFLIKEGDKYGYITSSGEIQINPKFKKAGSFSEGLATVKIDDHWGFIDEKGDVVIEPNFEMCFDFEQDVARVIIDGKWGVISKKGNYILKPVYNRIEPLSEDIFVTEPDWSLLKSFSFYDKNGILLFDVNANRVGKFSEGLAYVKEIQFLFYIIPTEYKYGFIDKKGEIVINTKFKSARNFKNGLA